MIQNGNYIYLDFDSIIPNLIDVFTEYYGEKHRQTITDKINNILYEGSVNYEEIADYYNQLLGSQREKIYATYTEYTGKYLTPSQREMLINDRGESEVLFALKAGVNIDLNSLKDMNEIMGIKKSMEVVCDAFNIDTKDPVDRYYAVREIAKNLDKAIESVEKNNPCDVYRDIRTYLTSKTMATRAYIMDIANSGLMGLSYKDKCVLYSEDYSDFDIANLDVNGLLFDGGISKKGAYKAFLPENFKLLDSTDEHENVLGRLNVLKWIYLKLGDNLLYKYLSPKKLMNFIDYYKDLDDEECDLINQEYDYQTNKHGDLIISQKNAIAIDEIRQKHFDTLRNGVKMKIYKNGDSQYYMTSSFMCSTSNNPIAKVYINESQLGPIDELFQYLIHEVNHCICLNKPSKSWNGKYYSRFGLFNYRNIKFGELGYDADESYKKDRRLELLEENINQRMSIEIANLYLSKYPNPYKPNDITYSNQEPRGCEYHYWNFMTDGFYNNFKDSIKEHRINPNYNMFYIDRGNFTNDYTLVLGLLKDSISKGMNEDKYKSHGDVDYLHVYALANYIYVFYHDLLPKLHECNIDSSNVVEDTDKFAKHLSKDIHYFLDMAQKTTSEMIADRPKDKGMDRN